MLLWMRVCGWAVGDCEDLEGVLERRLWGGYRT